MSERTIVIRALSPGELANQYEVSLHTFNQWLKPYKEAVGKREGLYFTVLQVKTIYEKLGLPPNLDE